MQYKMSNDGTTNFISLGEGVLLRCLLLKAFFKTHFLLMKITALPHTFVQVGCGINYSVFLGGGIDHINFGAGEITIPRSLVLSA